MKTLAQQVSTARIPLALYVYEYLVHPLFLRLFSGHYRFSQVYRRLLELQPETTDNGSDYRILDLACGTFWFGRQRLLARLPVCQELLVDGLDLSDNLLNAAQARLNRQANCPAANWRLTQGTAHHCPYPDGEFDEIWLCGALHQIPDQTKTLHEVQRLLKKGGHFYCQTFVQPHRPIWSSLQRKLEQGGFQFLDEETLRLQLAQQGLYLTGWHVDGAVCLFTCRR